MHKQLGYHGSSDVTLQPSICDIRTIDINRGRGHTFIFTYKLNERTLMKVNINCMGQKFCLIQLTDMPKTFVRNCQACPMTLHAVNSQHSAVPFAH